MRRLDRNFTLRNHAKAEGDAASRSRQLVRRDRLVMLQPLEERVKLKGIAR